MSGISKPRTARQRSTTDGGTGSGATDARTLSIVQSSQVVGIAGRALSAVIAAWRDSVTGTTWRRLVDRSREQSALERTRRAGTVTAVASGTALILQRLTPRPEPLIWIVPALSLVGSLCLIVAARSRPPR